MPQDPPPPPTPIDIPDYVFSQRFYDEIMRISRERDIRDREYNRPPNPKPGLFDPFFLAIPDWMLPSREGWYGRLYG